MNIPELRLKRLTKLIEKMKTAPSMALSKLFGSDKWDSDTIEWESQEGNRGMAPFSNENIEAPRTEPSGVASHEAKAAFWQEKMYLGAEFLNNIRKPGTSATYQRASATLARETRSLKNRNDRRKEWMFAKMLSMGSFSYVGEKNSKKLTVSYFDTDECVTTLGSTRKWTASDTCNIVEDIEDARIAVKRKNGARLDTAIFGSEILKLMKLDTTIQGMLKKSAFGNGDLLARPVQVLSELLGIPNMILYDDTYQLKAWLTQALSSGAGPHTIYVSDTTDYEAGDVVYIVNGETAEYEEVTVSAVSHTAQTITATGTLSNSYVAGRDFIYTNKEFIPRNRFCMFASTVDGIPIAEHAMAPFGNERTWGMEVDRWFKKDPDGVFIRVRNKGLPVLYHEDAIFNYVVCSMSDL